MSEAKRIQGTQKTKEICFYIAVAYLIYTAIYLAGEKIALFNTAWDLTSGFLLKYTRVLDLYRVEIGGGIAVLIMVLILAGKKLITKDIIILGIIFVIMGMSAILNMSLAGMDNLVETYKICNVVAVFYVLVRAFGKEKWKYAIGSMTIFAGFVWLIGCIYSLILYFINFHGYYWFNGFNRASRQGIMDGRLFGCFSDPNYAAFVSLNLVFILYWMLRNTKNKYIKVYFVASIVIYLIYIILSGSRSTYVTAFAATFFIILYNAYLKHIREKADIKETIKKSLIRYVVTFGVMIATYFVVLFAFQGIGYLIKSDRNIEEEFERNDVSDDNISNSRFRIWGDYIQLVKDKPALGFSSKGALIYATQKDPNSYLADRKYNTHNAYVFILVSTGIVGFLAFLAFVVYILIKLWKVKDDEYVLKDKMYYITLVVCASGFVYYFFNLGIMTSYRFETVLFWMAAGYLAIFTDKKLKEV